MCVCVCLSLFSLFLPYFTLLITGNCFHVVRATQVWIVWRKSEKANSNCEFFFLLFFFLVNYYYLPPWHSGTREWRVTVVTLSQYSQYFPAGLSFICKRCVQRKFRASKNQAPEANATLNKEKRVNSDKIIHCVWLEIANDREEEEVKIFNMEKERER